VEKATKNCGKNITHLCNPVTFFLAKIFHFVKTKSPKETPGQVNFLAQFPKQLPHFKQESYEIAPRYLEDLGTILAFFF
jgi:hypothetical protein